MLVFPSLYSIEINFLFVIASPVRTFRLGFDDRRNQINRATNVISPIVEMTKAIEIMKTHNFLKHNFKK